MRASLYDNMIDFLQIVTTCDYDKEKNNILIFVILQSPRKVAQAVPSDTDEDHKSETDIFARSTDEDSVTEEFAEGMNILAERLKATFSPENVILRSFSLKMYV